MNTTQGKAGASKVDECQADTAKRQAKVATHAHLATVNADPKWERRRKVIKALEEYKARLNSCADQREHYEILCSRLYSGRSSRITGMPTNHDQFAAGDHFAGMLDEKIALEKALAEMEEVDEMELALGFLDGQGRLFLEMFYLDNDAKNARNTLMRSLNLSSASVYKIRDAALDKLYNIMYSGVFVSENGGNHGKEQDSEA